MQYLFVAIQNSYMKLTVNSIRVMRISLKRNQQKDNIVMKNNLVMIVMITSIMELWPCRSWWRRYMMIYCMMTVMMVMTMSRRKWTSRLMMRMHHVHLVFTIPGTSVPKSYGKKRIERPTLGVLTVSHMMRDSPCQNLEAMAAMAEAITNHLCAMLDEPPNIKQLVIIDMIIWRLSFNYLMDEELVITRLINITGW